MRNFYHLTKPGIIYGNALTAAAGFFLALGGQFSWELFLATLAGLSLVVASACVFNNLSDRDIDKKMRRTKDRVSVLGKIPTKTAVVYGISLGLLGSAILGIYTNPLATATALIGFIIYVFLYTPIKKKSPSATLIGSVSGAIPPVVGYTAVRGRWDLGALVLFLILVFWQMPHFYSIAIRRLKDYRRAGIPVLPAKAGVFHTKVQICLYIIFFIAACVLLRVAGYRGDLYLGGVILVGGVWLMLSLWGFRVKDDIAWAKDMFLFSLGVILFVCIMIGIT